MLLLAALALASPSERLDRLIAAAPLDNAGLATLAETDPATAWQLLDPARRAAFDYVLALPAAEIRAIRQGQAVIRDGGEGSDAEWAALWRLAEALGEKPRRVQQVRVRTVDATLVRVDLELRRETRGVDIAFPADAAPPRMAVDLADQLGVIVDPPAPLQDGGFEVAWSAGLAWEEEAPAGTLVMRDTARVKVGATSLRLESHTRAVPTVAQVVVARPGERLVLTATVAPDGAAGVLALVFTDENGVDTRHEARATPDLDPTWTPRVVEASAPEGTVAARVELTLDGPGAANFDDVGLRAWRATPEPVARWDAATGRAVIAHVDPARCGPGGTADPACAATAAARLDAAVAAGLGRLSVAAQGTVDVWLFADPAHRAALTSRAPGGPRGFQDDPAAGTCWTLATSEWAATCPVRVLLERAWGPPENDVLGIGLPRALAGSGVDLHAAARPSLPDVPPLAALATSRVGGPSREAAITSFAAWLLDTQSLAAVRAAWQAEDLAAYTIAGQDLPALEAAWRASVAK